MTTDDIIQTKQNQQIITIDEHGQLRKLQHVDNLITFLMINYAQNSKIS